MSMRSQRCLLCLVLASIGLLLMNDTQPNAADAAAPAAFERALFGAGCFWGVQSSFAALAGVNDTVVGYGGGERANPSYEQVCTEHTGHAELVYLEFDPQQISYQQLLDHFFALHDPTTLNRQGPDLGSQYRSVIYYYSPEQQALATETIKRLQATPKYAKRPIVTAVQAFENFYPAEEYHQHYFRKRGIAGGCHLP